VYFRLLTLLCALSLVWLSACDGRSKIILDEDKVDAPVQTTAADPLQTWLEISKGELHTMDIPLAMNCVQQLAAQGKAALDPLFQLLDDGETDAPAKVLAVITLTGYVDASDSERLVAMTEADKNEITRGCAINLLAVLEAPETDARIKELLSDEDSYVRKEAVLVLLRRDDDDAVAGAVDLWKDANTEIKDRAEIVLAFPVIRARDYLFIYEDAACNQELEFTIRYHAIQVLGTVGSLDSAVQIARCIEVEPSEQVKGFLDRAQKAIASREEGDISEAPVENPAELQL
jgi:HEAT repeat protein